MIRLSLCAGGVLLFSLVLGIPLATAQVLGTPGLALPLHDIDLDCTDSRYPALAGAWIAWCSSGDVDRVRSLHSGEDFSLPLSHPSPGLGEDRIYIPGREGGLILLEDQGPRLEEDITRIHHRLLAPPAVSDDWIAVLTEDSIQAFPAAQRSRRTFPAHAAGWYPPALSPPFVAWVEDGSAQGEDLYWLNALDDREGQLLSGGPGNQRHVVASGPFIAWVEPNAVVILDTRTDRRRTHTTLTGFNAAPTLWQGMACWEVRDESDVDIVCSSGLELRRPGHQLWPGLYSEWLIFREEGLLFVYRMESSTLPRRNTSP